MRLVTRLLIASLLVTACSGPEPDGQVAPTEVDTATPGDTSAPLTDVERLEGDPASTATAAPTQRQTAEPLPPPELDPIAAVAAPIPWMEDGQVDIAVTSIEEVGELLRVGVTFTPFLPTTESDVSITAMADGREFQPGARIAPRLLDPVGLKEYLVVRGAISSVTVPHGVPRTLLFYFPAFVDDVDTFDMILGDGMPPLTDIPAP